MFIFLFSLRRYLPHLLQHDRDEMNKKKLPRYSGKKLRQFLHNYTFFQGELLIRCSSRLYCITSRHFINQSTDLNLFALSLGFGRGHFTLLMKKSEIYSRILLSFQKKKLPHNSWRKHRQFFLKLLKFPKENPLLDTLFSFILYHISIV